MMSKGLDTSSKNIENPLLVVHNILQCHTMPVNIYNRYSTFNEIEINH